MSSKLRAFSTLFVAGAAAAIYLAERRRPQRRQQHDTVRRTARHLVMGALCSAVIASLERPLAEVLARRAVVRRRGLVQRLPLPPAVRDALAFLLLDYTMYLWHVLTHKAPALWRLHLVHHLDLDLDSTTALRFHYLDMVVSLPWRALQVSVIGASPRAWAAWQNFFFVSVLFHHSNLRLPERAERRLAWLLTTPGMHAIHHSTMRGETNSNWSSGISWWDRLHGTFRLDAPQDVIAIGVPAYREAESQRIETALRLPFARQRDAWAPDPASPEVRC